MLFFFDLKYSIYMWLWKSHRLLIEIKFVDNEFLKVLYQKNVVCQRLRHVFFNFLEGAYLVVFDPRKGWAVPFGPFDFFINIFYVVRNSCEAAIVNVYWLGVYFDMLIVFD